MVAAISESDDPVKVLMEKSRRWKPSALSLSKGSSDRSRGMSSRCTRPPSTSCDAMEEYITALTGDLDIQQLAPFRAAFRNVFERIVVHPTTKRKSMKSRRMRGLSAIMGLDCSQMRSTTKCWQNKELL